MLDAAQDPLDLPRSRLRCRELQRGLTPELSERTLQPLACVVLALEGRDSERDDSHEARQALRFVWFEARMPRNAPMRFTTEGGRPPRTTAAISRSFSSAYGLSATVTGLQNLDNC